MVFPAKYRKVVFGEEVEEELKNICLEISKRYEIIFLEIGTDGNHVHFLIQSVPMYSVKKIVQMVKSITAREMFRRRPEVKEKLWGGEFWSDGYFVGTVGVHGNEETVSKYVKKQGIEKKYKKPHQQQLTLPFE
jgi:REP element-mobilizing transposase RayT